MKHFKCVSELLESKKYWGQILNIDGNSGPLNTEAALSV